MPRTWVLPEAASVRVTQGICENADLVSDCRSLLSKVMPSAM